MSLIKDRNVGGKKEAVTTGGQLPKLSGDALVALEPFEGVFGSKKTRKRPRLQAADLTTLATQVSTIPVYRQGPWAMEPLEYRATTKYALPARSGHICI